MKLSGPNPRPSFSLSLALASNPFTPPRDPHPLYPQFSTIIPCRSGHCQSKDPREGGPGKTCVCVHVCVCLRVGVHVCMFAYTRVPVCIYFGIGYVFACSNDKHHIPVHTHVGAVRWESVGGFPAREPRCFKPYDHNVEALGPDLDLGVISNT